MACRRASLLCWVSCKSQNTDCEHNNNIMATEWAKHHSSRSEFDCPRQKTPHLTNVMSWSMPSTMSTVRRSCRKIDCIAFVAGTVGQNENSTRAGFVLFFTFCFMFLQSNLDKSMLWYQYMHHRMQCTPAASPAPYARCSHIEKYRCRLLASAHLACNCAN